MKKILIVIVVLLLAVLLIPTRMQMRDGGTVQYDAIIYDVYDVHRIKPVADPSEKEVDYITGVVVEVLGVELINTTNPRIDIHK